MADGNFSNAADDLDAATAEQIDKDLHRAGRVELGVGDSDLAAHRDGLRTVLRRWASQPNQSYHQAMCFVGATLLVWEQDVDCAFAKFAAVMRSLPADYYGDALVGCRADVRALRHLAASRWPDVYGRSAIVNEPLELVCTQWLLALFGSLLPAACCQAIWNEMAKALTGDDNVAASTPSDLPLRVGLVLLENVLETMHQALEEDAAEEHTGGGCASYAALQGAASAWEGQPADLLAAAHALELPAVDVASARNHARREINAEDAIERARRATKKAAALLQATGETSRETSDARPRRQRHALMKFSSSSSTADASTTVELQMPTPCRSVPLGDAVPCVVVLSAISFVVLAASSPALPVALAVLFLTLLLVALLRRRALIRCARTMLDLFLRRAGEPGSLSHTLRRLRPMRKPALAARDDAAIASHSMAESSLAEHSRQRLDVEMQMVQAPVSQT